MKKYLFPLICFLTLFVSCGDDLPTAYEERYVIEAFVIGGEPISDIRIVRTYPINTPFDYSQALVRDAEVIISDTLGNSFRLEIAAEGEEGYYFPDSTYLVQTNMDYTLNVKFADNKTATGKASVPDTFSWVEKAPDFIYYPTDSQIDTAVVDISWTGEGGFYLLESKALDTLEYGIYLDPPTDTMNMRVPNPFRDERAYDNTTTWGLLPTNESVVIWGALRWYGLHEVSIFRSDFNMLRWFLQARGSQQYNDLLNTIEGDAIGCFGGASVIRDTSVFLFPVE